MAGLYFGSGGAGLRAAISARMNHADVLLATKYKLGRVSNTYICKSIIAASGWGIRDMEFVQFYPTAKGNRGKNCKLVLGRKITDLTLSLQHFEILM